MRIIPRRMSNALRRRAPIAALLTLGTACIDSGAHAQSADYTAPRLPGTTQPDLNGIYQALNAAHWDVRPHAAQPSAIPELLGALHASSAFTQSALRRF